MKMPIAPESILGAYTAWRRGRRGGPAGRPSPPEWRSGLTPGGAGRPAKPAGMTHRAHPRTGPNAAAAAPVRTARACGPETAGERPVPASV